MKISKKVLEKIIAEELQQVLNDKNLQEGIIDNIKNVISGDRVCKLLADYHNNNFSGLGKTVMQKIADTFNKKFPIGTFFVTRESGTPYKVGLKTTLPPEQVRKEIDKILKRLMIPGEFDVLGEDIKKVLWNTVVNSSEGDLYMKDFQKWSKNLELQDKCINNFINQHVLQYILQEQAEKIQQGTPRPK